MPIFSNSRPSLRNPPVPPPLPVAALPWLVGEGRGRARKEIAGRFAFQRLDLGTNPVAQRFKPGPLPAHAVPLGGLSLSHARRFPEPHSYAAALQLIAPLQPREQVDHPDHAILDRPGPDFLLRPVAPASRRPPRPETAFRRSGRSPFGPFAGIHSVSSNASVRASTCELAAGRDHRTPGNRIQPAALQFAADFGIERPRRIDAGPA